MTAKIKLIFGALGLVALVSVLSLYGKLRSGSSLDVSPSRNKMDMSLETDADHDGLSDAEESIWGTDFQNPDSDGDGFKDGEEVLSGHDPMKKGPDDLIDAGNITNALSGLALAGLVEGSLKPSSSDYAKSLNSIADSLANSIRFGTSAPRVIKTIPDSREGYSSYLRDLSPIFKDLLTTFADELDSMPKHLEISEKLGLSEPSLVAYYREKTKSFKDIIKSLEALQVPKSWKEIHIALIDMASGLSSASDSISTGTKDPIRAYAAFSYTSNKYSDLQGLLVKINDLLIKQGIDPKLLISP